MLLYFSSTHPFLNLHTHSVELNFIRYDIHCFDNYASIYNVLISVYLSITSCYWRVVGLRAYTILYTLLAKEAPTLCD